MLVMLGDEVTLMKNDTWVTGRVAGVVLDNKRELERIYLHEIAVAFWMSEGWRVVDDSDDFEIEEDDE